MEPMDRTVQRVVEERGVRTAPLGPQAQAALLGETAAPEWWVHVEREEPEARAARRALSEALVRWDRPVILVQGGPLVRLDLPGR